MAEIIKTVTDESEFGGIFNRFFIKKNVFLRVNNENVQVDFRSYKQNRILAKANDPVSDFKQAILLTRSKEDIISIVVSFISKSDEQAFLLTPLKIQFFGAARKEERKKTGATGDVVKDGETIVCITDLVTDTLVEYFMTSEKKKIDLVKERVEENLKEFFNYVEAFFPTSNQSNLRMKFFHIKRQPIFITNIEEPPAKKSQAEIFDLYMEEIYKNDTNMRKNKYRSESTVPILYKAMIPLGYIQCNKLHETSDKEFTMIRRMGVQVSDLFLKNNIIKPATDQIPIADVSKSGLGIRFRNRSLIKFFKEDSYVQLNVQLAENKKTPMLIVVRNINILSGGVIKVGCEIVNIDALGEVYFDEFLEKMGISTE
ncbi:MAG: hypothetical protein GY754_08910 [bacterium]|nr:hypothetical protein [bacterium]